MISRRAGIARLVRDLLIIALILLGWIGPGDCQPPLKVGALIPYAGRWGDAGRECARGMLDASRWINQQGGVYGRKLEILIINDTHQLPETIAAFRKLDEADHVLILDVYSTDTALTLLSHIQFARIPTFVSFLPSHLANPAKYPFLFSIAPTPLDLSKIAMTFISEKSGIKARKPKVLFLGSPNYLDRHFLEEAKTHAYRIGLEIGPDILLPDLSPSREMASGDKTERTIPSLLEAITRYTPDYVYLSLTSKEAFSLLQEAYRLGLKARWIANMRAFDETLAPFEGIFGVQPLSPFGEGVPGMGDIEAAHRKWHPYDTHTLWYTEGWANIRVMAEVLGRSLPEEGLSREKVKESIESLRNFLTGGLIPPVTITRSDHRPSMESRILVIEGKKLVPYTPFVSIGREGKGLPE